MFKVGDKVVHLNRSQDMTGVGTVIAISKKNKRYWVKWANLFGQTLNEPEDLQNLPEPATLLKELL